MPRRVEGFWFPDTSVWSPGTSSLFSGSSLHNSTPHIPKPPHTAQLIIFLLSHYFSREKSESPPFPDDTLLSRIYHNYPFISSEAPPPNFLTTRFYSKPVQRNFPTLSHRSFFPFPQLSSSLHSSYSMSSSPSSPPLPLVHTPPGVQVWINPLVMTTQVQSANK